MRRLMRPAVLLLLVAAVTLPAVADKAKDLYAKGQDAEARQQYEAAYAFFKKAYDLKPKDIRYRTAFERIRFEAAASIVHTGQKLRDEGKLDDAVAEFQKALAIDPSLFIAKQELDRTLKMINDQRNPPPQAAGPPAGLERRVHEAAGPVELAPISNIPITVKMLAPKSDVVYRTIGQLAGINVLFDPDYTPRVINVDLNGVTLDDALEITALESKTFWRPVTSNTIFVAQDNPAKRKELEQSVLKTFYLTNLSAAHRTAGCGERDSRRARCAARAAVALAKCIGRARHARPDRAGGKIGGGSGQGASGSDCRHRGDADQQRQVAHPGLKSAHQRHGYAAKSNIK